MAYGRGPPPAGGDENRGTSLRIVTIVSFTFVVLSLVLRMWSRIFLVHKVGWDDYTIVGATVIAAVNAAFVLEHVANGGGRHTYYLSQEKSTAQNKWSTLSQMPLNWSITLTKMSICLLIIRISNNKRLIRLLYGLMAAVFLVNTASFIDLVAQCRPLVAFWDYTVKGKCWSHEVLAIFAWIQGGFSIITDLICCTLPVIVLWNIKITVRQKVAICGLIGLGLFTTGCCIARIYLYGTVKTFKDSSYTLIPLEIWTELEQNIGIIVTNMPPMRPAFKLASETSRTSIKRMMDFLTSSPRGSGSTEESSYAYPPKQYPSRQYPSKVSNSSKSTTEEMVLPLQQFSITEPDEAYPEDSNRERYGNSGWAGIESEEGREKQHIVHSV